MARNDEEESNDLAGDDETIQSSPGAHRQNVSNPQKTFPQGKPFPSHMRNLRRAMIEQFEFEFMRLLNLVQLKDTIQKADVESLVVELGKAVGELQAQNRSIISEELGIREKAARCSLNID